jgi:hypothetical protein
MKKQKKNRKDNKKGKKRKTKKTKKTCRESYSTFPIYFRVFVNTTLLTHVTL